MNPNFTFPQPQPARTRPVVEIVGASPTSRESNALRASVLETALLLGVGSSNTVTDWMFNPLQEEEDEENTMSPALTYASTATSEESFNNTPSNHSGAGAYKYGVEPKSSTGYPPPQQDSHTTFKEAINSNSTLILSSTKETDADLSRPTTPSEKSGRNKLKKRRTDGYGTGHESEEGYTSEGVVRRKTGKKQKQKDAKGKGGKLAHAEKNEKNTDEKKGNEGKFAEAEKKVKAKEEKERAKEAKKASKKLGIRNDGYETDGRYISDLPEPSKFKISRSKSKSPKPSFRAPERAYETDSGHLSSAPKQKRSFFRLTYKSSKTNLPSSPAKHNVEVRRVPSMPLPIAEMFSTTGGSSAIGSRVGTPAPPPLAVGSGTLSPAAATGPSLAASSTFSAGPEMPFHHDLGLSPATSIYSPSPVEAGTSVHSTHITPGDCKDKGEELKRKGSVLESSDSGSSNGHGKTPAVLKRKGAHPVISLPLTRPISPPPVANSRPVPSRLYLGPTLNTGQASISPIRSLSSSPLSGSTHVLVTPVDSPSKPFDDSLKGSNVYPATTPRAASQLSIVPSSEYIVPSPSPSPTLPSVLAYYDLPPPTPPPSGPLPRPPQLSPAAGRSRSPNPGARAPNANTGSNPNSPLVPRVSSLITQPVPSIYRRDVPFPIRTILPQGTINNGGPELEPRLGVRRYKDFRAIAGSAEPRGKTGVAPGIQVDAPSDNEDDDEGDMRDLLERFAEEAGHQGDGRAVPTRRSFEDLRDLNEAEAEAEGEGDDDDDRSYYPLEEARGRKTSTSTSVFSHASVWVEGDRTSRGSFLDGERSEEARQRFLRRVTAMFDESGREKDAVPPVPKLPPGVANQRWGRF